MQAAHPQDHGGSARGAAPAHGGSVARRFSDFVMMFAVGIVTVIALLGGIAGSPLISGPAAPAVANEHFWAVTGVGGFVLGLSWRFLFWDLPGMIGAFFRSHRRNLKYLTVLAAGVALLVMI